MFRTEGLWLFCSRVPLFVSFSYKMHTKTEQEQFSGHAAKSFVSCIGHISQDKGRYITAKEPPFKIVGCRESQKALHNSDYIETTIEYVAKLRNYHLIWISGFICAQGFSLAHNRAGAVVHFYLPLLTEICLITNEAVTQTQKSVALNNSARYTNTFLPASLHSPEY